MSRFVVVLALLGVPTSLPAQLKGMIPVDIRVPTNPIAVWSEGHHRLVYELRVTNIGRKGLGIKRVEVSAAGTALASWEGDSLKSIALRMGESGDGRVVGAGKQVLLYLLATAPQGDIPKVLEHRLFLTHPDSLEGPATDTLARYQVTVASRTPVVVRAPLRGGPWVAVNGPGNTSGHRRTAIPIDGLTRVAQRFATDWIRLGPDGRAWKDDSTKNENWYGYNEPLHAVGAGRVVAIKDGIIENVPFSPKMAVEITLETVGGNHVIIDLGDGNYAFYAHLIPGSVAVKVGDKVSAGQVIGRLGNSGNSTAPHLHFHMGDQPSPLGTEGVPFLVDEYTDLAVVTQFLEPWTASGPGTPRRRELPFENHVVRFKAP